MFTLHAKGPFSWAQSLSVLARWQPMSRFAGGATLAFNLDGDFAPVVVRLWEWQRGLRGEVRGTHRVDAAARQVARIFSLDHDAGEYPTVGERSPALGRLMGLLWGLRPVCFPSPYEAAVWAILSQRVSMDQAARLKDRLLGEHGVEIDGVRCLPPPDRLARVGGLPAEKLTRLRALAEHADLLDADRLRALGDEAGPAALTKIRGIGRFWSQGIYLRACGIRDVWPDEPRAQAAARKLGGNPDDWRPFRMWACFLLRVADGRGLIQARNRTARRAISTSAAKDTAALPDISQP
jgi:DNA-3-methyladenine glycosylase II